MTAQLLPSAVVDQRVVVLTATAPETIYFSYAAPTDPAAGDIWIHTVDNGGYSLSIAGDQSIVLTPGAVMQYSGTAWVYCDAYVGVSGEWKLFSTLSPLSSLSWAQVVAMAESGEDPSKFFAVGDEHPLVLTSGDTLTVLIGDFNHNTITGTGKTAALAFTFKDCLGTTYQMNSSNTNSGGWNGCAMRTSHMPAILNTFPADCLTGIKYVDVVASKGSQSTALITSSDRLRLHSITELGLSYTYAAVEGKAYAYYTSNTRRIKKVNGTASIYWTRSPYTGNSYGFCDVNSSGAAYADGASTSNGVACGFDI